MTPHRRWIWRLGRKLYCWSRSDLVNDPEVNGEYWLIDEIVKNLPNGSRLIDAGANRGDWSLRVSNVLDRERRHASIYAFEPCAGTRAILESRIATFEHIHILPYALSSTTGDADFYSTEPGLGTNSLHPQSGSNRERVKVTTLDRFVEERSIDHIAMLKIDTEGFDCQVLRGAQRTLAEGVVDVVQFEYNWRWLLNKSSLLDVFSLINGTPYRLGKLTGSSIIFFDDWHFELDRFFEGNYLLLRTGSPLEKLGQVVSFDGTNVPRVLSS